MTEWLTHNLKDRTFDNKLPFSVTFNFHQFSPRTFKQESENVCKELYEKHGDNLYLAFSGGADSEYILKTFMSLGIPIRPVIVMCPYNLLDIKPAFLYCRDNNIKPILLKYGNEYLDIAQEKIYSRGLMSPIGLASLLVYDYVKQFGGKVVTGQGEPLPITNRNIKITDISQVLQMFEFEFYMDIYAEDEQPAPFYSYNQNIFYTYLLEVDKNLDLEEAKCKLYDIPYRPKTYWSEEIYSDIRKNNPLTSGFYDEYNVNDMLEILKGHIV